MNTKLPLIAALMATISTPALAHSGAHAHTEISQLLLHMAGSAYHIAGVTAVLFGIAIIAAAARRASKVPQQAKATARRVRRVN